MKRYLLVHSRCKPFMKDKLDQYDFESFDAAETLYIVDTLKGMLLNLKHKWQKLEIAED